MVFQPIVSAVDGALMGAEALARFDTPDYLPPDRWFQDARDVGLADELELQAVAAALIAATQLPDRAYVSINVSPWTLAKPQLLQTLRSGPIPLDRVVIEVTEHVEVTDYQDLAHAVRKLRAAGARIAVDDAGAGYSSFRHILSLAPEFIKLDRSLISGLDEDPARRALTAAVVMFGLEMQSTVIAEGIETPHEFTVAQTLGIDAAQGYLFGRPTDDWQQWKQWNAGWQPALRSGT
jgi:EAL domain-containing protein (putative c-di-GMP-specific phosphodiesterase class I)